MASITTKTFFFFFLFKCVKWLLPWRRRARKWSEGSTTMIAPAQVAAEDRRLPPMNPEDTDAVTISK